MTLLKTVTWLSSTVTIGTEASWIAEHYTSDLHPKFTVMHHLPSHCSIESAFSDTSYGLSHLDSPNVHIFGSVLNTIDTMLARCASTCSTVIRRNYMTSEKQARKSVVLWSFTCPEVLEILSKRFINFTLSRQKCECVESFETVPYNPWN